MSLETNKRIY